MKPKIDLDVLIRDLRKLHVMDEVGSFNNPLGKDAADAIEFLRRERDELRERCEKLREAADATMNLYRVRLRGLHGLTGSDWDAQTSYVVAPDAESAYRIVRRDLDQSDYGFTHERELERIELIANEGRYPACKTRLYLLRIKKGEEHELE